MLSACSRRLTAFTPARALLSLPAEERPGLPPLRGDAIEETLSGTPGFIYWTGAKYSWFPKAEHDGQRSEVARQAGAIAGGLKKDRRQKAAKATIILIASALCSFQSKICNQVLSFRRT